MGDVDGDFLNLDDHEASVTPWFYEFGRADCKPKVEAAGI
jgi:hypothetical protein